MQSTKEYKGETLELHYYFDASVTESKGQLYNDDGKTPNTYENGAYELLHFESELEKSELNLEFVAVTGTAYTTSIKTIEVIIHNITRQPNSVKLDGKKVTIDWNSTSRTLSIPLVWNTAKALEIKIKLKK